ncbi:acyltransferase family protein [Aliiruegeria lutimaris]|uniref:SGNH domain-containing protein n=1 Tax=Aliiruegeria lutimaris TaxID=571298 RepID=A0A1G8W574_9RHOB|nr:acyltransferase family protein [Aliiruegeria lutimaris]SDJ73471.1 hypothetical protein SAMN04488026_102321 [Aliiruegeria lutimaris]
MPRLSVSTRLAHVMGIAALLSIAVIVVSFDERAPFPGWIAAGPVLATAALIYCGAAPGALSSRFLSLPPMVFIGRISYSLYLWHWPVIVFVNYSGFASDSTATKLACIAASFLLASLSWALIEEPVRRRRILQSRIRVYGAAGSAAAALALSAALVIWNAGFPGRVPPECFLLGEAALTAAPCLRGATGQPPSFLLIGDSHAFALSPGLFRAASEGGLSGLQFTSDGFFPGPGRKTLGTAREDPRIARALEIVAEHPEIPTVILAGAWADYATGTNWKGRLWLYEDDIATAGSSAENVALFSRALERFIAALPERQVILLDDVAAGRDLDLNAFVRHSMLRPGSREDAILPYELASERRAVYAPILLALAEKNANVTFVPVFADFCPPTGCPLFAADLSYPIYRDGDHLSNQAALLLKDRFTELLLPDLLAPASLSCSCPICWPRRQEGDARKARAGSDRGPP